MLFRGETCLFPSGVACQPYAAELPARCGRKEIAVAGADVRGRRGARSTSKNILVHHELAVIFSYGARSRAKARIRRVGARGPLPGVAVQAAARMQPLALEKIALERTIARGHFPFRLGRQPRSCPARIGVSFEITYVHDRMLGVACTQAVQRELVRA